MDTTSFWQQQARLMAERVAAQVLDVALHASIHLPALIHDACDLLDDLIAIFHDLPQAVALVQMFHSHIESWERWERWTPTLGRLLNHLPADVHTSPDSIYILLCHAQGLRELGNFTLAHTQAATALTYAQQASLPHLIFQARGKLGSIALRADRLQDAVLWLDQALQDTTDGVSCREIGHAWLNRGVVAVRQGDNDLALVAFDHAKTFYDPHHDALWHAKVLCNRIDVLRQRGLITNIPPELKTAQHVFLAAGNLDSYAQALNDQGCLAMSFGDMTLAHESFERALTICRQIHHRQAEVWIATNLLEVYVMCHRHQEATELIATIRPIAVTHDWSFLIAAIDSDWGTMLVQTGDLQGALACWQRAWATYHRCGAFTRAMQIHDMIDSLRASTLHSPEEHLHDT